MDIVSREYPSRPLIGVGAVIIKDSRIVLVRRSKPPSQGQWSIPGGLVHVGETLAQAVAREAFEETSLTVKTGPMIDLIERIFRDESNLVQYHYVIADYKCSATGGVLMAGSDASEAQWVPRNQLGDLKLPAITLEIIEKAFSIGHNRFK